MQISGGRIDYKSLKDLDNEYIYSALLSGLNDTIDFENLKTLYNEATQIHYKLFDDPIFYVENDDNQKPIEYILPTIRKAYHLFFIEPPMLLNSDFKRSHLELFQLQFNLKEFLEFISKKYITNHKCLDDFKNLDNISEILSLAVNDYLSEKLSYINNISKSDILKELRDDKLTKKLKL